MLTGDNYPHRIPMRNDEERLNVYNESGEDEAYVDILEHLRRLTLTGLTRSFQSLRKEKI